MPSRVIPFVNGEFYHILNRGVAQIPIFSQVADYKRFLATMIYYQVAQSKPRFSLFAPTTNLLDTNQKTVEIICYCLMPNHFHLLLQQVKNGGITEFVSKLSNSYAKHFNLKNKRVGPLFQGEFKAIHVDSNEQLLHLSRYIHLNPLVSNVTKRLEIYEWSSYREYVNGVDKPICSKEIILDQFKSRQDYKKFILDQENYARKLEMIKHQLLE